MCEKKSENLLERSPYPFTKDGGDWAQYVNVKNLHVHLHIYNCINPLHANGSFLYLLKTYENLDVIAPYLHTRKNVIEFTNNYNALIGLFYLFINMFEYKLNVFETIFVER